MGSTIVHSKNAIFRSIEAHRKAKVTFAIQMRLMPCRFLPWQLQQCDWNYNICETKLTDTIVKFWQKNWNVLKMPVCCVFGCKNKTKNKKDHLEEPHLFGKLLYFHLSLLFFVIIEDSCYIHFFVYCKTTHRDIWWFFLITSTNKNKRSFITAVRLMLLTFYILPPTQKRCISITNFIWILKFWEKAMLSISMETPQDFWQKVLRSADRSAVSRNRISWVWVHWLHWPESSNRQALLCRFHQPCKSSLVCAEPEVTTIGCAS